MVRRHVVGSGLVERDEQLARVCAEIEALEAGTGSVLVLSGPAGIGKTALLQSAVEFARDHGIEVLTARGDELERDLGHGVTRQLLDRAVRRLNDRDREVLLDGPAVLAAPVLGLGAPAAPPSLDPEFAARHGLTWLLAGLAEHRRIVLALDDAQWADPPSLRWLAYLARRLDQTPVMVLLSRRTGETSSDEVALDAIRAAGRELALAPLSASAVASLVRARVGPGADADLIGGCISASGGNPYLLHATLVALDEEGPSALGKPLLAGARRVAPTILRRLERLPGEAAALGRAVAVLGDGAELAIAAELADLPLERAARAADTLVLADLFAEGERLRFAHGLVRDAVTADLGAHALRAAHGQAARVLRQFGAAVERIAAHLMYAPPARDPAATADLREAARRALAQGAPTSATSLLRRALAEPQPPGERGEILLELGIAELMSAEPGAAERLDDAIDVLKDPRDRSTAAQARMLALVWQNRVHDAVATIDRVRADVAADDQLKLILDAQRLWLSIFDISRLADRQRDDAHLRRALSGAEPGAAGTRGATIMVAAMDAIEGAPSAAVRAAVDDAWGDGTLLDEVGPEHVFCSYSEIALLIAGELEALHAIATQLADRAAAVGSQLGACQAWMFRAVARARMGRLADAEADAELASRPAVAARMRTAQDGGRALLAGIAVERGELAKARALLAAIDPDSDVVPTRVAYAISVASLARAEGAVAGERAALRDLQRLADAIDFVTWSWGPWPPALAVSLGPSDEAHELADQALTHARRRGRPGEIGIALRAQALTAAEGADIERLRAAVTELEQSELALEHARTLIDLGAALRRRKYRNDARPPLVAGLEQAVRCGATALTDRARTELLATGARPRRLMVTGRDALTTSERRIAMLAAEGRSNREIAQTLFVTPKTVENHLSHIYQKLAISSRAQLPRVLTAA